MNELITLRVEKKIKNLGARELARQLNMLTVLAEEQGQLSAST